MKIILKNFLGVLDIYQELLSVKFTEITGTQTWHNDVSLYSVDDAISNNRMGYFYLDLFPREGKFGHAACFSLQPGCRKENGERMVCLFFYLFMLQSSKTS